MPISISATNGLSGMPAIYENATVSAIAATGTINYNVLTQSVLQYTTNASGNWTLNIRGDGATTLNSIMLTGQSINIVFMAAQGSPAFINNVVQIDGVTVTPRWQGGSAPVGGNVNSTDLYTYAILKTGNATYNVFASLTRFA